MSRAGLADFRPPGMRPLQTGAGLNGRRNAAVATPQTADQLAPARSRLLDSRGASKLLAAPGAATQLSESIQAARPSAPSLAAEMRLPIIIAAGSTTWPRVYSGRPQAPPVGARPAATGSRLARFASLSHTHTHMSSGRDGDESFNSISAG